MLSSPTGRPKDSSILESRSNGVDNETYMHVRAELLDMEETHKARSETSSSWMVSSPEGRPKDSSILESHSNIIRISSGMEESMESEEVDKEIYMHMRAHLLDMEEDESDLRVAYDVLAELRTVLRRYYIE